MDIGGSVRLGEIELDMGDEETQDDPTPKKEEPKDKKTSEKEEAETDTEDKSGEVETEEKDEIEAVLDGDIELDFDGDDTPEETEDKIDKASSGPNTNYLSLTKKLIDEGIWEDFEELGDIEELTKEDFDEIRKAQKEHKDNQVRETILSEFGDADKEYLEFRKNGGDLDTYYQSKQALQQVQNIDTSTDEGKQQAFYYYHKAKGLEDKDIQRLYKAAVDNMSFDEEAEEAGEQLKEHFEKAHQQTIAQQKQAAKEAQERIKQYEKDLKKSLKDSGLDTKQANQITKSYTNVDKETGLAEIDKLFLGLRQNPEMAADLYNFLLNPEDYKKKVSKKERSNKETKEFKLTLGKRTKDSASTKERTQKVGFRDIFKS